MPELRERLQTGRSDRYRFEGELGRGGMATVFLAASRCGAILATCG